MEIDGLDPDQIASALEKAKKSDRPTLIAAKTIIGYGAPTKAGTAKAHGSPLGTEEIVGARKFFDWGYPPFEVPEEVMSAWRKAGTASAGKRAEWQKRLGAADPKVRAEFERRISGELPAGFDAAIAEYKKKLAAEQAEGCHAQVVRDGAGGDQRRRAGDDRRLGRPYRLQQHQDQPDQADHSRATTPIAMCTTAFASTAWRRR